MNTTVYKNMVSYQDQVLHKQIFKKFLTKAQKQEMSSKPTFVPKFESNIGEVDPD